MSKARKTFKKVVLVSRDLVLMRSLFESKIMSRDQINQQFFPNASKDAVNKRLRKIARLGLIRKRPVISDDKVILGYSLTQRGFAKIKPTLPYEVNDVRSSSECPQHDIALNDIRKAFEGKPTVQSYHTENVLQNCDEYREDDKLRPFIELNSDAMAEVDSKIGLLNLAIEFDATHKSKNRYSDKINDYYVELGVDGVLYICANKYILNVLLKVDQEMSECHECEPKLYFALLADVIAAGEKMTFTNVNGDIFCVR